MCDKEEVMEALSIDLAGCVGCRREKQSNEIVQANCSQAKIVDGSRGSREACEVHGTETEAATLTAHDRPWCGWRRCW